MRRLAALALLPALLFAPRARADEPKTLALAAVTARGGADSDDADEMTDALETALVADGRLRLVERRELQRVMKEQALSQSGVMSDAAQIKVAQLAGARFIAVGAVQAKGSRYTLSLRAIDAESGQVAFAASQRIGSAEQIEAGSTQLARKLADRLAPSAVSQAQAPAEVVGDFDPGQVKDMAQRLARAMALRFPKVAGKIVESVPNGTATCSFPSESSGFAGQFYEISGVDELTGQPRTKGYFLLQTLSAQGCAGKFKAEAGQAVGAGDALQPAPIKVELMPLEAGAGAQAELAKALTDETRAALEALPQFQLSAEPQLAVMGRVAGPHGQRSVQLQVVDKKGNVVAKVDQPGSF